MTYWIDGQQGGTITGDLASQYFGGSDYVHFGFTGATGGAKNLQQVKVTSLTATYAPADPPPPIENPPIPPIPPIPGTAPQLDVTKSGAASYAAASNIFTLTPDATNKTGAVMSNDRIDITHDFTLTFSAFLGSNDAGADGIAFVLHNAPSGADAIGGARRQFQGSSRHCQRFGDQHRYLQQCGGAVGRLYKFPRYRWGRHQSDAGDISGKPRKLAMARCDGVLDVPQRRH